MQFEALRGKIIIYPIFSLVDILKWFPKENPRVLKLQLNQWQKKGYIERIKRGLYFLSEVKLMEP